MRAAFNLVTSRAGSFSEHACVCVRNADISMLKSISIKVSHRDILKYTALDWKKSCEMGNICYILLSRNTAAGNKYDSGDICSYRCCRCILILYPCFLLWVLLVPYDCAEVLLKVTSIEDCN